MRYASVILFILVLAAPFVLRRMLVPGAATQGQSQSGTDRLVIITPHPTDIRKEFARAFSAWHRQRYGTDVEIDYRVPGGTSDVKRQLEATYRAYRDDKGQLPADVPTDVSLVWGGGDYLFDRELKPLGVLQPLEMSPEWLAEFRRAFPQPTLAGVKLYEDSKAADGTTQTPKWIGVCLSSFGICYNPDVYKALQIPDPSPKHGWRDASGWHDQHGWHDLTDPRLAGFVALADPAHSGSSAVAYQMVIQNQMAAAETTFYESHPDLKPKDAKSKSVLAKNTEYRNAIAAGWKDGMSELLKIAANARYFTDSSTLVPMDVSRGEAAAGMSIDHYSRVTEETVGRDRIRYFAPDSATAITPDPVAILYGTKDIVVNGKPIRNLTLAKHFIEFLLTSDAQRLWQLKPGTPGGPVGRSLRRMPIRQDVYGDRTDWADDNNPFQSANGFNQRGEWMGLFADSRPIWVAAWIDSRDALHESYRHILEVQDETRRRALIDELADLPIEMKDVESLQIERTRLEKSHGELDEWRATQRIFWARTFRDHYRNVAAKAQ